MAKICKDLKYVAEVLDQFHQFLGPELRAVTGDAHGIEQVSKRVESLIEPLESNKFDIFDSKHKARWDGVMSSFRELVKSIEQMTKGFIDSSFKDLRSAEGAFDLLQKFEAIKSRESINRQMAEKFDDILVQYTKEVEEIHAIFHKDMENPPVYKNYPPVAGSIAWANSLFQRVKKPILRFKTKKKLFESEKGQEAKVKYLVLAREIDLYIKERFAAWNRGVPEIATMCLKQSILGPVIEQKPDQPYQLAPPPYHVNFAQELSMIIGESKHLDRMGFAIPEAALNVTLQEDKYHEYVQQLNIMLRRYDQVLGGLNAVEHDLLVRLSSKSSLFPSPFCC